jgi:hypothetical protein
MHIGIDVDHCWAFSDYRGAGSPTPPRNRPSSVLATYQPSVNFSASITPVPHTMVPNRLRFHA